MASLIPAFIFPSTRLLLIRFIVCSRSVLGGFPQVRALRKGEKKSAEQKGTELSRNNSVENF